MKRPAIPSTPNDPTGFFAALKENIEVITGRRGDTAIAQLKGDVTLSMVADRLNQVITVLQGDAKTREQVTDPTAGDISQAISQAAGVFTGMIVYLPVATAPAGWLECAGNLVLRATYPALWDYAQASGNIAADDGSWQSGQFSPGDGATTFRLPQLQGEFIRGWDNGRGVDSGRAIGTAQDDDFESHSHGISAGNGVSAAGSAQFQPAVANGIQSTLTGGTETRPRNVALMACIKY